MGSQIVWAVICRFDYEGDRVERVFAHKEDAERYRAKVDDGPGLVWSWVVEPFEVYDSYEGGQDA